MQIDAFNLVYIFKTGGDFGNYQMPLKLFEFLIDFGINPKEALNNQSKAKYTQTKEVIFTIGQ